MRKPKKCKKAINFTEIINKNSQIDIKIQKIAEKNGQIQKNT